MTVLHLLLKSCKISGILNSIQWKGIQFIALNKSRLLKSSTCPRQKRTKGMRDYDRTRNFFSNEKIPCDPYGFLIIIGSLSLILIKLFFRFFHVN